MTPDGARIFVGRIVRTLGLGELSLGLPLMLARRGLSPAAVGAVFTATLIEDAVITTVVTALAPRWGRRRLLVLSALPMALGGVALATVRDTSWLLVTVVFAVVSVNGLEAGPFSPLEQATLPEAVPLERLTKTFA